MPRPAKALFLRAVVLLPLLTLSLRVRGFGATQRFLQNTYLNWYLDRHQRAEEFEVLTTLVSSIECCRVIPSSDPARLPALAELVERHVLRLLNSRRSSSLGAASSHV